MSHFDEFEAVRDDLFSIAYRMLGTITDAEDVLQDAFIRWEQSDRSERPLGRSVSENDRRTAVHRPPARARQCSASNTSGRGSPSRSTHRSSTITTRSLPRRSRWRSCNCWRNFSPVQRAVFLLHDVFDYDFNEVAEMVDESPANCRQQAKRARDYLAERRPRFEVVNTQHEELTRGFLTACQSGDLAGLQNLLARDVALYSDGGGKVTAARKPLHGSDLVAKFLINISSAGAAGVAARFGELNGQPALILEEDGDVVAAFVFAIADGADQNIFVVRNPDKLQRVKA